MPKIVKIWSETLAVTHKGFAVSCLLSVKWLTGGLGQYQRRILSDPQCLVCPKDSIIIFNGLEFLSNLFEWFCSVLQNCVTTFFIKLLIA